MMVVMNIDRGLDGSIVRRSVAEFRKRAPANDLPARFCDRDGIFVRRMMVEPGLAAFERFRLELVSAGGTMDVVVVDVVDRRQVGGSSDAECGHHRWEF